uniref:Amiloride-sensitive sodium channel n=1 Tax=Haemonchus contortus TaxID=6289 RepID=A0A7I4XW99_HAECO
MTEKTVKKEKEATIFKKGLIYILHDFSWWTSTHGIPHIGLANAQWLRILWIIIVLCCFGGFIWQFVTLFTNYLAYRVNTETELQFSDREFATVTLCHLNAWKKDESGAAIPKMRDLIDAYQSGTAHADYDFSNRFDGKRQQSATKFTALMSENLYSSSKLPGANHAYTYEDLVITCTYNAKSCNTTDFREFYDPSYGICHMFNFDGSRTSSRAGPLYGLRMVIRTDQAKYLPWTETAGVIMSIHGKDDVPFPDVFGYFAAPGTATSLGVRFISTSRLPAPYGTCTRQETLNGKHYNGKYEVESCFRDCLQDRIVTDCGCYDPAYHHADDGGATPSCADGDQLQNLACIDRIANSDAGGFNIIRDCVCPQPCEVDSYSVTVSTAKWPSTAYKPEECQRNSSGKPWDTADMNCLEWYQKNTLLVEIYYERMNFQVLTESPAYSLVNLVSDVGGQVGLFLGMSIISVIELLTLLLLLICYCATHKSRKREIEEIEKELHNARGEADRIAARNKRAMMQKSKGVYGADDHTLPPPVISPN